MLHTHKNKRRADHDVLLSWRGFVLLCALLVMDVIKLHQNTWLWALLFMHVIRFLPRMHARIVVTETVETVVLHRCNEKAEEF
jgi:hypothetical protein